MNGHRILGWRILDHWWDYLFSTSADNCSGQYSGCIEFYTPFLGSAVFQYCLIHHITPLTNAGGLTGLGVQRSPVSIIPGIAIWFWQNATTSHIHSSAYSTPYPAISPPKLMHLTFLLCVPDMVKSWSCTLNLESFQSFSMNHNVRRTYQTLCITFVLATITLSLRLWGRRTRKIAWWMDGWLLCNNSVGKSWDIYASDWSFPYW